MTGEGRGRIPVPCQAEFFLAETYSPYSAGRVKCRRRWGHTDSHMASLRVKIRGVKDDVILDVPWPNDATDDTAQTS